MDRLEIRGGKRLEGSVEVRGAKNATLPQIAASLLSAEPLELSNVPDVSDVASMLALMRVFGVEAAMRPGRLWRSMRAARRTRKHLTISCAKCARAFWCWRRCLRASVARACHCRAAAPSARARSICI